MIIMEIKKFIPEEDKQLWDNFVLQSKNGLFLFLRDYMEYHSDRFEDYSLIFYWKNKPIGLMPANINIDSLASHNGLTFGGIITNKKMKMSIMLEIFDSLKEYLKKIGIEKLLYKPIPHIYHRYPSEEDLYALYLNNAGLVKREVSSTIIIADKIPLDRNRKRNTKIAKNNGLIIKRSYDFTTFMDLKKQQLLKTHGVKPTHTAKEMEYLGNKFKDNIKLFAAERDGEMVDGVIIYESNNVAHAQYQGATDLGLELRAPDLILEKLINEYYKDKKYFDLGISTEDNGNYLNEGLISFKERFGARAVVHDAYEMSL
jgi:hypothetical protein